MIAPQGYKVDPAKLESPAGARKRRKASVKKRRNTAPRFKRLDPKILYELGEIFIFSLVAYKLMN